MKIDKSTISVLIVGVVCCTFVGLVVGGIANPYRWNDTGKGSIAGIYSHNLVSGQFNNIHYEVNGKEKVLCVIPGDPCWWPTKTLTQLESGKWYRIYYRWDTWYPTDWPRSGCLPTQWEYFIKAVDKDGNKYLPLYE